MKASLHKAIIAFALVVAVAIAGCGGVSGHTYQTAGGLMQIEFQSGGKANVSLGPQKTACTYTEDSKTVTVTCEGDKIVFTIGSDGSLNPPSGNFIGPLTRK